MRQRLSVAGLFALAVIAGSGCQKSEKKPAVLDNTVLPHGGGSSGAGDASTDGTVAACPALSNDAAQVGERFVDVAVPTALGGVIATGTYFLTAVNAYTGAGGNTGLSGREYQETLVLEATTYTDVRAIGDNEGGVAVPVDSNGSYSTSLTSLALTPVCPHGASGRADAFTVSANTLHIFEAQNEFVYTLQ